MSNNRLVIHELLNGEKYTPEAADRILEDHLLQSLEHHENTTLDFTTPYPFTHPVPFLVCLLTPLFSEYKFTKATLTENNKLLFIYPPRDKGVKLKKNIATVLGLAEIRSTSLQSLRISVSHAHH